MAPINIDMAAYQYSEGLRALSIMFQAGKGVLAEQTQHLNDLRREYEQYLERGGEPIGVWDDEGYREWDQDDLYRLEQLAISDAVEELRVATTIAIYHHWERHVPNPNGERNRRHDELARDAKAAAVDLHHEFGALHCAANYLKHGNEKWLSRLAEQWPSKFASGISAASEDLTWHRRLRLSDEHVGWFFELARVSERPVVP